ncbi:hypothetical protein ACH3XW_24375 [Acanthocheilonema viteae]
MILFVCHLRRQQQQLLLIAILLQLSPLQHNFNVSAQWITVAEFSMRVPGHCTVASDVNGNSKNWRRQQFDCDGNKLLPQQQRRCIPLQHFHDGIVDCPDGSDEFCFPGYVKCGSYCVSLQYAAQCFINPRCDNSPTSPQFCDVTKKKLCSIEGTVPCKGYGECVMRKWIEKGQTNCIDKSDQDPTYIAVFGIKRGTNLYPGLQFGSNISDIFHGTISTQTFISSWLQSVSPSPLHPNWRNDTDDDMTKDWNNATIQSTTKQFVFQIPNNRMIGNKSDGTITTYQLHFTTVKSSIDNNFTASHVIEMLQSPFIHRTGENPTEQQILEKLKNSINASTNPTEMAKSPDAIRIDNKSNRSEYSGTLKQDNIIPSNGISLSANKQHQNQNGTFNPSPNNTSNDTKNTVIKIQKESQQIPQSTTSNQQSEETNITDNTTSGLSPDQAACLHYEYAEAQRLVPKPWCTCPPGQMPSGEHAACKTTIISTFGIDVHRMCGGIETNPEERSRLAILVLNRTQLPYQACVRRDGHPVMVQLDCSHCTTMEFDEAFKRNSNDQYIPLHIMELSLGACLTSALNDCDPEHADCLVNGPRYECQCHEGWNDTSKDIGKAEGRRCEQLILLADGCILFLGYCLFWWFLLLGIILFLILSLLCLLSYKLYKWCQKRRRRNVVVDEQGGHLVTTEIGSVKNTTSKLATTESINMNNNPNSISSNSFANDEKAISIIDSKYLPTSNPTSNQNISKTAKKVLINQESIQTLDSWQKNDEIKRDKKQKPSKKQSQVSEQTFDEMKSERKETVVSEIIDADSLISSNKKLKKTKSESHAGSSEISLESQKSTNMMLPVVTQKDIEEVLPTDGNVIKNFENVEPTNSKVMNVSQSLSETSLRTMWELFKQGTWKQSSRPSSIKSSTSSLDRLIDVFLFRKRSKKIHPDAITASNSIEYSLDTVKIVDHRIDTASQLSNTISPIVITCCSTTATTATTTTTTSDISTLPQSQHAIGPANDMVQRSTAANVPMQTHVLEQKIITETRTLTTKSTISLQSGELPQSLKVAAAQSHIPINSTVIFDQSKSDQQSASDAILTAANEISQQSDSIDDTTAVEVQHSTAEENTAIDQERSRIVETENEAEDQMYTKPSTTTIVTSSDTQLERWTSIIAEPKFSASRKTQSEHGRRLNDNAKQKTLPTADELKDALKEVASTKPPTKRLTEKQKKKLSASCGHLYIQDDNKMDRKGYCSIYQSLATARQEPRRKLSSISEKSTEMMNGVNQLISTPSSISCPTTTRRSKGFISTLQRNFNPMNDGSSKLEHNRASTKVKLRKDSETSSWRQRPISIVDSRPSWNFSPLKDGDLDRIAPLQPNSSHGHQRRKWLSPLPFDDERAADLRSSKRNSSRRGQSDWTLHNATRAPVTSTSHSARLHTRLPFAKMLRDSSSVKWTPYDTEDHSKLIKEQLWWGVY